jgi:serine protease Do
MSRKTKFYFISALIATGVLFFFLGMGSSPEKGKAEEASPVTTIVIKDEGGFSNAVAEVADVLTPTVVHIDVTGTVTQKAPGFPYGNDPFFRYFFGPPQETERQIPVQALGSGVIISKDGYIITNNHVVENADTIIVELYDGTTHEAELVGRDPSTDLAVIKIKPTEDMKYALLGDSDRCRVGEWVVAIGSPRGLDWTVTAGIVSAKNRTNIGVLGPTGYEDFIQTDAAINPGNSGGPLINLRGEVIGINSLIVSASRGSEGLGFSIPSNMVKAISGSLIKYGKVVRGYLGVNIQDVTPEIAKSLKLGKSFKGVIIADVLPDGPAAVAGIEQGDIVLEYSGEKVENVSQLRNIVADTRPGSQVKVKILRSKKELELTVKIGELGGEQQQASAKGNRDILGLTVEKVTPEIAKNIGLRKATGVIITGVEPGSAAANAGLEEGDIIFRVGSSPVNDLREFSSLVKDATKEGEVLFLVRDGKNGRVGYIVVPLKE